MRISSPGKYSYADIRGSCQQNQTSLTAAYLKYVAQAITEKEEPLTAMVIKGAVYRTRTVFEKTDMILPADSSVITSGKILFAWHPSPTAASKYLKIYENGLKEVYSQLLPDTSVIIESDLFRPQVIYFWLVTGNQIPTDDEIRFTFVFGEKDWRTDFLDNEAQWMKELESEIEATQKKIKKQKP
jgi:hypothetical protein